MELSPRLSRRCMERLALALAAGFLFCTAVQGLCGWGAAQLDTGARLAADTLRLHVRAAGDSVLEQSVKLRVRDAVLAFADARCPAQSKDAARVWAARELPALRLHLQHLLLQMRWQMGRAFEAQDCAVRVRLVNMYFDAAQYRDAALPAGRYDALRVELGASARGGKNWWCVLYPGLCRAAAGGYALPEENDLVCGEYLLRFRLVDWWQQRTAAREDTPLLTLG